MLSAGRVLVADSLSTSHISRPITFAQGPFRGRTIRAELQEIQKADHGRKYARKDRRPLDPPPVVLLKFFEVRDAAENARGCETEINVEDVDFSGILCHIDLFPVPRNINTNAVGAECQTLTGYDNSALNADPQIISPPSARSRTMPESLPEIIPNRGASGPITQFPVKLALRESSPNPCSDPAHYVGGYSIQENCKRTTALVGATVVQFSCVNYEGKGSLMAVFSDLAVTAEGIFIPRYRVFDITSREILADGNPGVHPILAESYGSPFKIYSTKDFPGLSASTDLTKHLSYAGVRVNSRQNVRKRQRSGDVAQTSVEGLEPSTSIANSKLLSLNENALEFRQDWLP